ncbi:ketohydroxyglutarate aldolase [Pseudanabaena sp. BC1403]|uniref:ketohydroxyglutarate aldolase n=1 Tax=Pseudanabaena sp. BC1403 TaxID=2043171 RepID=UPI000CD80382|nr:ketohydroxyglutarate aldolase [Pseudanabaena sp. BC1403]
MSDISLMITVDNNYINHIPEVVKRLEAVGVIVERTMEEVGIIAGSIDATKIQTVSNVDGVKSVEESAPYQLPNPESELW